MATSIASSKQEGVLLGHLVGHIGDKLETIAVHRHKEILLGRSPKSHVVLPYLAVSNDHFRLYSTFYESADGTCHDFVYAEDLSTNGMYWQSIDGVKCLIGKGQAVLLSDDDRLILREGPTFEFKCPKPTIPMGRADLVQEKEIPSFSNLYRVKNRILGSGMYGKVLLVEDRFRQKQKVCKVVRLKWSHPPYEDFPVDKLWREIDLLRDISHPNIIQLDRVFYTGDNLYLIEPLICGGDLTSYLNQRDGSLPEMEAALIVYQILKAFEYLHGRDILHRDLKPDNVLLSVPRPGARVILTDFGTSIQIERCGRGRKRLMTECGTIGFYAPEVYGLNPVVKQKGYTAAADMWSLGVLTTSLFTGRSVFDNTYRNRQHKNSHEAMQEASIECDLEEIDEGDNWLYVDKLAKKFIKRLLVLEEKRRMTVDKALQHAWLTHGDRGKVMEEQHQQAIESWKPSWPKADFKEDLCRFMRVQAAETDVRTPYSCLPCILTMEKAKLMPPPHNVRASKRPRPEETFSNGNQQSPHFLVKVAVEDSNKENHALDEDEFSLYNETAREKRGFRTAKAFGDDILRKKVNQQR